MNEQDFAKKNELFLKFAEEDKEFERKLNANIELSVEESSTYFSRCLEIGEINAEYGKWKTEQFNNLTLYEVIKIITANTISIYEEKYERQYQNFLDKLNHATNFGKKESQIYNEETIKWYIIIDNPRNGLIIQLGNEKIKNVSRKVESYIQMLGLKEGKDKGINDDFEALINPTPNQLTEKEIELDEFVRFDDEYILSIIKRGENLSESLMFLVKSISKE